jgi:hypothetical protein
MVIEVTVRIILFFAIYLAAVAWLCFEERRRPARRQMKSAMAFGNGQWLNLTPLARRRNCKHRLFVSERDHRVYLRRPPRWQVTGRERH